MIESDEITTFRLVRVLALGQGTSAMYLLVCSKEMQSAVEGDLNAETEVQLGFQLALTDIEVLLRDPPLFRRPICGFRISEVTTEVVALLDTHVVRLKESGSQMLFLATDDSAEQLLVQAPNFRSRLTQVMRIIPDPSMERVA